MGPENLEKQLFELRENPICFDDLSAPINTALTRPVSIIAFDGVKGMDEVSLRMQEQLVMITANAGDIRRTHLHQYTLAENEMGRRFGSYDESPLIIPPEVSSIIIVDNVFDPDDQRFTSGLELIYRGVVKEKLNFVFLYPFFGSVGLLPQMANFMHQAKMEICSDAFWINSRSIPKTFLPT